MRKLAVWTWNLLLVCAGAASIVWVFLAHPAASDDAGYRATIAGWGLGVLLLLGGVVSSLMTARRQRRTKSAKFEQRVYPGGRGFQGGKHEHHY